MAYAGKEFVLKLEDPGNLGSFITIGGGKSCSVSISGSAQSTSDFIGQVSELAIPGTKQTTTTISASGVFVDSDAEQVVLDLKFSGAPWQFKVMMASSKVLTGYFYVTSFSRIGDMSAAEGYSLTLQGDNISVLSIDAAMEEITVAWSATRKPGSGVTLSNANKTATSTSGDPGMVLATVARSSGRYYFEIGFSRSANGDAIGVVADSYSGSYGAGTHPGWDGNGWAFWTDGYGLVTVNSPGAGPNQGSGRYGVAIDFTTGKVYFRFPSGGWGMSLTGDPVAGTNPDYSAPGLIGTAVVPAVTPYSIGNNDTLYTKASDFTLGLPSGYTAWASQPI